MSNTNVALAKCDVTFKAESKRYATSLHHPRFFSLSRQQAIDMYSSFSLLRLPMPANWQQQYCVIRKRVEMWNPYRNLPLHTRPVKSLFC